MTFDFNGILLRSAGNERSVPIAAATLGAALDELTARFPDLKRVLLDNTGHLRRAHRMSLNGEVVNRPAESMTLSESDRIEFFTAVAGG